MSSRKKNSSSQNFVIWVSSLTIVLRPVYTLFQVSGENGDTHKTRDTKPVHNIQSNQGSRRLISLSPFIYLQFTRWKGIKLMEGTHLQQLIRHICHCQQATNETNEWSWFDNRYKHDHPQAFSFHLFGCSFLLGEGDAENWVITSLWEQAIICPHVTLRKISLLEKHSRT